MEGPWGTGSKEAVKLIFEEEVWAIVGSHDGRNAHLVEQAATKARIVFLSSWASDPTLSQAFVPWYYSCVPNDNQQAAALIEEIYNKRKYIKVATVSDSGYDSKLAIKSFVKLSKAAGKTDPLQFFYKNDNQDLSALPDLINKTGADCIILFGQPEASMEIVRLMRSEKMKIPVFGSLSLLNEKELSEEELKNYESAVLVTSDHWLNSHGPAFREEFQKSYGYQPGAYAYDGMNLIIEAVRKSGLDREKIQKSLKEIKLTGVTGLIQFDDKGNRLGSAVLMEIKNGIPVEVGR
jgi:branched-chain amino acid transport system substrate-binding protein